MFELIQIASAGDFRDRIFPIFLKDSKIYNVTDRLDYMLFGEEQTDQLDKKLKKIRGPHLTNCQNELNLFSNFRNTIDDIIAPLSDMNCLNIDIHKEEGFNTLIEKVTKSLAIP